MQEPRSLARLTIHVVYPRTPEGPAIARTVERTIRAELVRLPDDDACDAARRIERYRGCIEDSEAKLWEREWYGSHISMVKTYLLVQIQARLDTVNHETHEVKVVEDTAGLLPLYHVLCQHCSGVWSHSLGPAHGLRFRCDSCGDLAAGRLELQPSSGQ